MPPDTRSRPPGWTRLWPLGLILAAAGLIYALGLHRYLSFEALSANRAALVAFVAERPFAASLLYILLYIAVIAFSVPVGVVLTAAGGFLFGPLLGTAIAAVGATLGACALFLAVRHALAETVARRLGPMVPKLQERLARDGFWYLLSIRLVPVVPFWFVNLATPLSGIGLAPYAGATFLGIIPATAVTAGIGAGLGHVLEAGGRPDFSVFLSPGILLPLLGLATLSLLGIWWRHRRAS